MGLKRFKLFGLIIIGCLVILSPAASFAHTFRSDGPIRVLLHVDPEDDPSAKDSAQLNFFVFDDSNQFLGSHCDCNLTVSNDGKTVLKQTVFTDKNANNNVAVVPFVFPTIGVYQIVLTGKPKPGFNFHPFNLTYTQRVDQTNPTSFSNKPIILVMEVAFLILISAIIVMFLNRKNPRSTPPRQ